MTETDIKLEKICFPIGIERREKFKAENHQLAYYTTEDTAKKILRNKELWMRNASVMNDYSEIRYGINLLSDVFFHRGEESIIVMLKRSLDSRIFNILLNAINDFFGVKYEGGSWLLNTYITSFTEHTKEENQNGRLSMWRTYGDDNGVAIVFKRGYLFEDLLVKNISLTSVVYAYEENIYDNVLKVIGSIINHQSNILDILNNEKAARYIMTYFKNVFGYSVVSLKHIGFKEEAEWRLIAHGLDLENELNRENFEIENVKGIDQLVFKIKFEPKEDFFEMIDYVLIGPNADMGVRNVTSKVFARIMMESFGKSREEVDNKIKLSGIPYRPM